MKLELCPFCGSDDVELTPFTGGCVECHSCTAAGPCDDPKGEKWNALSRAVHGSPAIESIEVGPMPWRLQIAAVMAAGWIGSPLMTFPRNMDAANTCLSFADTLIAAQKATEVKP